MLIKAIEALLSESVTPTELAFNFETKVLELLPNFLVETDL